MKALGTPKPDFECLITSVKKCFSAPVIERMAGEVRRIRTEDGREFTLSAKLPDGLENINNSRRLPISHSSMTEMPPVDIIVLVYLIELLIISYLILLDSPSDVISLTYLIKLKLQIGIT